MNKKASSKTKPQRETSVSALKPALLRRFDRRITSEGEIEFPCIPTMLEHYTQKLASFFTLVGRGFSDEEIVQLRKALQIELDRGYKIRLSRGSRCATKRGGLPTQGLNTSSPPRCSSSKTCTPSGEAT